MKLIFNYFFDFNSIRSFRYYFTRFRFVFGIRFDFRFFFCWLFCVCSRFISKIPFFPSFVFVFGSFQNFCSVFYAIRFTEEVWVHWKYLEEVTLVRQITRRYFIHFLFVSCSLFVCFSVVDFFFISFFLCKIFKLALLSKPRSMEKTSNDVISFEKMSNPFKRFAIIFLFILFCCLSSYHQSILFEYVSMRKYINFAFVNRARIAFKGGISCKRRQTQRRWSSIKRQQFINFVRNCL